MTKNIATLNKYTVSCNMNRRRKFAFADDFFKKSYFLNMDLLRLAPVGEK